MRLSVIIPAFNAGRLILDTINSALAQRFPAGTDPCLQLIVADNGSVDGTADLVSRHFGSRVLVLHCGERQGGFHARNTGVAAADGDWIAFLDQDDLWHPDKLQRQLQAGLADPGLALLFCQGVEFSDPPGAFPCRQEARPFLLPSALMVRRDTFQHTGPFPPFRAADFIAWFGWSQSLGLRFHVVPEPLLQRRVHRANTSRDRAALVDYPLAMNWLLRQRSSLAQQRAAAP